MDEIDTPELWQQSFGQILTNRWRKIIVVGAADRGKTTYCNLLSDALLRTGVRVAFVDGDVGQKDVGPPGTITLSYAEAGKSLSGPQAQAYYFVGAVNPTAHLATMIIGTRRMVDQADAEFVIIDTTGLVQGIGKILKALQNESLQPDVIVLIEKDQELSAIYRAHRHLNVIRLPSSALAKSKSSRLRRSARQKAFRSYFAAAKECAIALSQLVFQRTALFSGVPITDPRNLYTEQNDDSILAVSKKTIIINERRLKVVPSNFADQLLCGVTDARGECLGLAIVRNIDFSDGTIRLFTPLNKASIKALQFGHLYVDSEGRELEQQRRGHF